MSRLDMNNHRSFLYHWDARLKLIAMFLLAFAFSSISSLRLIPVMLLVCTVLFFLSGLSIKDFFVQMKLPGMLILMVCVLLIFFTGGEALVQFGPIALKKEGLLASIVIGSRMFAIMALVIILFQTTSFVTIMKAMRSLRIPRLLVDMMFFTYRYLFETGKLLRTMETSMRLRGFRPRGWRDGKKIASLIGHLFIRSYDRSDRVYYAMCMRGYGRDRIREADFQTCKKDWFGFTTAVASAVIFMGMNWLL